MYTYTYKYILTHVTKYENFQYLKGGQNLRYQVSNNHFVHSDHKFFEGSETHILGSQTQNDYFLWGIWESWLGSGTQMTIVFEGSEGSYAMILRLKEAFFWGIWGLYPQFWDSNDSLFDGSQGHIAWFWDDFSEGSESQMPEVIWNLNTGSESQKTCFKMWSETQILDLSLKEHFPKCDLKLKYWIWVSKNIFQNVFWNSNPGYESQRTVSKMWSETQILDLSLKEHFPKCDLKLKSRIWVSKNIFQNVIWNSNTTSESQRTFSKMWSETQIPDLSLKQHFPKCDLKLKYHIWVSKNIFQNVI